ncbi:hypothetical protein INR49_009079, partial [Caranx melampygus]
PELNPPPEDSRFLTSAAQSGRRQPDHRGEGPDMSVLYTGTLACHALMVPCVLRRASEGVQGPEYQLEAVELAVM